MGAEGREHWLLGRLTGAHHRAQALAASDKATGHLAQRDRLVAREKGVERCQWAAVRPGFEL